jgi:phosphate transport system protein
MTVHFFRQIDKLKKLILGVGAMVEQSVNDAVRAIETRDPRLAQSVIENDDRIDLTEIDVEEECLATLALHQPVAMDLRYVVAVLKINNDLERMGDLAKNMAQSAIALADEPPVDMAEFGIIEMGRRAGRMVKQSLDALVELDVEMARQVRRLDDEVDEMHRAVYGKVADRMKQSPHLIEPLIRVLTTARYLERIADHAVNVAKDVIYMVDGKIARHRKLRERVAAQAAAGEGA